MKAIVLLTIVVLINTASSAQNAALTYDQTQDEAFTFNVSNNTDVESYRTKDGTILRAGSPLVVGRPSTNSNTFTYLWVGKLTVGNSLLGSPAPMSAHYQAEQVVVDRITVTHTKMSKRSPLVVNLFVTNKSASTLSKYRTVTDYEKAFLLGEIINPNAAMTRDEAIKHLKEAKDLLDLQIITQARYDSIKAKLTPIITGN